MLAGHSDLFFSAGVDNVPGTNEGVFRLSHSERSSPGPHKVNITKLVSSVDHTRHSGLLCAIFESVRWLTLPDRVQVRFDLGNGAFADVHFSKFTSVNINVRLKSIDNGITRTTPCLLRVVRWAKREVSIIIDHLLNESLASLVRDLGWLLPGLACESSL